MATETGKYYADFLVVDKLKVVELEIKTSKADLNNDFKKPKHRMYAAGNSYWIPNLFYFAVPESMAEYAVAKCIDKKYGVVVIKKGVGRSHRRCIVDNETIQKRLKYFEKRDEGFELHNTVDLGDGRTELFYSFENHTPWKDRVKVVKRAKALHNREPDSRVIEVIIKRLSSEMANLRASEYSLKESKVNVKTV